MFAERALVSDIQRFSLHDGPGVRTVVFFKGCPLRCLWCQNPESMGRENELLFERDDCIACGDCVPLCASRALRLERGSLNVDWSRCDGCLQCVDACPSRALAPVARSYDVESLAAELLRDREFYGADGGITLSGGEPLLHGDFVVALVARLRRDGLSVAVETSGYFRYERVAALLAELDLILYDVKAATDDVHRSLTGVGNRVILDNLRALLHSGAPVRVRMPVVPSLNTDREMLRVLATTLRAMGCEAIWLLPYHRLWESKLAKIGRERRRLAIDPPGPADLRAYAEILDRSGLCVHVEHADVL